MVLARRPRLAIEWLLLALVVYLAALGASVAVRLALVDDLPALPSAAPDAPPAARTPAPLVEYSVIAERDIFNPSRTAAGEPDHRAALRLWGVALQGREARAVIEDTATHRQDLYRVGDRIGDARIAAIDWDRVTLAHGGGEEALELAPPATAPASDEATEAPRGGPVAGDAAPDDRIRRTGENAFVVDRRELAGAVDNMSGLLTQLRAVPEVREGRPAGFRLFQVRGDGLFARLGLRDGDVVQRVNGQEVGEPSALLGFLQRLRSEPRVAVDIVRGDAPRTLVYDLR